MASKKDYIERNRAWIVEKSKEDGVNPLPRGLYYKVIKSGDPNRPSPKMGNVVTVHYTGKLINGKSFDSNRGEAPGAFRMRELISGWAIALQQMHLGDRWEVYIPAEQGYGTRSVPGIPGGSTLVFDIELIGAV